MPITDPTDVGAIKWFRADDPAFGALGSGTEISDWPCGGTDGESALQASAGSGPQYKTNLLNGLPGIDFLGGRHMISTFLANIPQPYETFVVFQASSVFAYQFAQTLVDGIAVSARGRIGWSAPGGGIGIARIDGGTELAGSADGVITQDVTSPAVFQAIMDSTASELRIDSGQYLDGDAGADDLTGLTLGLPYDLSGTALHGYLHEIVVVPELTATQCRDLLDYFNSRWGAPDFAADSASVLLVSGVGEDTVSIRQRFALQRRGHDVTILDSSLFAAQDLSAFDGVVYTGNYADRVANGVALRASIDAGRGAWVSLLETGMTLTSNHYNDSVAATIDVVDDVHTQSDGSWGNIDVLDVSHDISAFFGTTGEHSVATSQWSGRLWPTANFVGDLLAEFAVSNEDTLIAIEAGTTDLNAAMLMARVVVDGTGFPNLTTYWNRNGEVLFQTGVEWMMFIAPDTTGIATLSAIAASDTEIDVLLSPHASILSVEFQASTVFTFATIAGSVVEGSPDPANPNPATLDMLTASTGYYVRALITTAAGTFTSNVIFISTLAIGGSTPFNAALVFTAPTPLQLAAGTTFIVSWTSVLAAGTTFTLDISDDLGATFSNEFSGTATSTAFDSTAVADGYYVFRLTALGHEERVLFLVNNSGTFDADIHISPVTDGADLGTKYGSRQWNTAANLQGFIPPATWPVSYVLGYDTQNGYGESAFGPVLFVPTALAAIGADGIFAAVEIGFGSMGNAAFWWDRQYDSQGWTIGIGVFARGTQAAVDSTGIFAFIQTTNSWPGTSAVACPDDLGATYSTFNVHYQPPPGAGGVGLVVTSAIIPRALFAITGCTGTNRRVPEVFLNVTKGVGSVVHITAGAAGYTFYDDDFDTATEFDCGFAGPVMGRIGDTRGGGFAYIGAFHAAISSSVCDTQPEGEEVDQDEDVELEVQTPSRPCSLMLQVYDDDRITELYRYTDDPFDPVDVQLLAPLDNGTYGEQEIDVANGRAKIAAVSVTVVDYPTIAGDQDSGIVTSRLPDALYRGNIAGRRCRLRRFIGPNETPPWQTIIDGPAGDVRLHGTRAGFTMTVRDTRETERRLTAFDTTDFPSTTCVFPPGVADGFGDASAAAFPVVLAFPNSGHDGPLLYDTDISFTPVRYVELTEHFPVFPTPTPGQTDAEAPVSFVITDEMAKVLTPVTTWAGPSAFTHRFPNLLVQWRSGPGIAWTSIEGYRVNTLDPEFDLTGSFPADVTYVDVNGVTRIADDVRVVRRVYLDSDDPAELPPVAALRVFVRILYRGPATDYWPFHFEGEEGVFLKNLLDGLYSRRKADGSLNPTGVRYDPAELALMTDFIRVTIREPIDDVRKWAEENIYKPHGWIPRFNFDMEIAPTHQRLPAPAVRATLTEIDNEITEPSDDWNSGTRYVNILRLQYDRLYTLISGIDPFSPGHANDGIRRQEVLHELRETDSILRQGEHVWESAPSTLHSIGFPLSANSITSIEDEIGYLAFQDRIATLIPRYAFGAPIIGVRCFRCPTQHLQAGDFVRVYLTWLPDYFTARRGLKNFGQLVAIGDESCASRFLTIELSEIGTLAAAASAEVGFVASGGTIVESASTLAQVGFVASGGTIDDQQVAGGTAVVGFVARGLVLTAGGTAVAGLTASGGTIDNDADGEAAVAFLPGYFPYGYGLHGE